MTTLNLFAAAAFIVFGVWVAHRLLRGAVPRTASKADMDRWMERFGHGIAPGETDKETRERLRGVFDADRVRRRK